MPASITRSGKVVRTAASRCARDLLYMVQSRDTETRALVLRVLMRLEERDELDEGMEVDGEKGKERDDEGLGETFWKAENISFVVNTLKDTRIITWSFYFFNFYFLILLLYHFFDISNIFLS